MPLATAPWMLAVLFGLYGLYAAATDGNAKAWISRVTPQAEMGTATDSSIFLNLPVTGKAHTILRPA